MKTIIKNLTLVIIGGIAACASSSAFAQAQTDYLYMGFQNQTGGGSADYIINLGPSTNIVGGSTVVTLSSDFSYNFFTNVLSHSSSMYGGVVGGNSAANPTAEVYMTLLRTNNIGNPAVAGSILSGTATRTQDTLAIGALSTLNVPSTTGAGILDSNKTWEADVEPANNNSTFYGNVGINPDSAVNTTTVLYEDLWYTTDSQQGTAHAQPFTYEGYFTLNLTGSTPVLTFTPLNAPAQFTQRPTITSIVKSGTTVTVISINAVATHQYQLQFSSGLSPASWSNIGSPVTASTTTVTNTDTSEMNTQGFYQIQAQ